MLYEELKSWQGGIGSLFGLLAILLGALYNFHLNRKRDERIRSEEVHSVAAALYGEILLLRNELAGVARSVSAIYVSYGTGGRKDFDNHFLEVNQISDPYIYRALASKFGFLEASLLVPIAEFYSNLQSAKRWLPLLVEKEDRGFSYSPLSVLVPVRSACKNVETTLEKIEDMLSIERIDKYIDLGLTDAVIEMEEINFEIPS